MAKHSQVDHIVMEGFKIHTNSSVIVHSQQSYKNNIINVVVVFYSERKYWLKFPSLTYEFFCEDTECISLFDIELEEIVHCLLCCIYGGIGWYKGLT